jgi:hypothetical protein
MNPITAYIQLADKFAQSRYYYWLHNNLGTPMEWLQHEYSCYQPIVQFDDTMFDNLNTLG